MHCPNPTCRSLDIYAKRKFGPSSETNMARYAGINCYKRHYSCRQCGSTWRSVEITEADFDLLGGISKLRPTDKTRI